MKRFLSLVLLLLIVAMAMPAVAEESVTLTFAFWGNADEIKVREQLAQMFMDKNPNIKIECTYVDGSEYPTKMQAWFAAGDVPDVMGIANDILRPYMGIGMLADLNEYVERDGLSGTWDESLMSPLTGEDGVLYAIPSCYKIYSIAYNESLFDAAGLEYPQAGWTEEEMLEMARQLTKKDGRIPQYGFYWGGNTETFVRNLYGNPVYDVANQAMNAEGNAEFRHTLEMLQQMICVDGSAPDDATAETYGGGFETGIYAMALVGPWSVGAFEETIGDNFEWDIVELPVNTELGHWTSIIHVDGWCMSASTEHPEESWEFIKFLTSDIEAQRVMGEFATPSLSSYAASEEYLTDSFNKSVYVDMLDYAVGWETTGVWARVNDVIKEQYQMLLAGQIDVDTAIANIQSEGTALLAE